MEFNQSLHSDKDAHKMDPSYHQFHSYSFWRLGTLFAYCLIAIYLSVSLITYEWVIRQKRRRGQIIELVPTKHSSASYCRKKVSFSKRRMTAESKSKEAARLRMCSIACTSTGTVMFCEKLCFEVVHIFSTGLHLCEYTKNINFVLTTWTLVPIYLLLWLRQRSLLMQGGTSHLKTSLNKFLSMLTFVLIWVTAIVVPVLFILARQTVVSDMGCHFASDTHLGLTYLIVTASISIVFHGSLLYLFICPLLKHTMKMQSKRMRVNLKPVIYRAICVTIFCVISDVLIIVSMRLLSVYENAQIMMEDTVVIANIVSMLLVFVNWKDRVCHCNNISSSRSHAGQQTRLAVSTFVAWILFFINLLMKVKVFANEGNNFSYFSLIYEPSK